MPMVVFCPIGTSERVTKVEKNSLSESSSQTQALTVLNTSEMATVGDSDSTSMKLGVTRDQKRNADAADGPGSYSDAE